MQENQHGYSGLNAIVDKVDPMCNGGYSGLIVLWWIQWTQCNGGCRIRGNMVH